MLYTLAAGAIVLYIIQKYLAYRSVIKSVNGLEGYRTVFGTRSLLGNLLPPIRGFVPGNEYLFENKHLLHEQVGWDIYAMCSLWPARVYLILADADAIRDVTMVRHRFPRPAKDYGALAFFGSNVVTTEDDEWKRYRKIVVPAFTDRNNKLVWNETMRTIMNLFDNVWKDQKVISVDHCADITASMTLSVIGAAAFGRKISWGDDQAIPKGYTMSYTKALRIVARTALLKLVVPKWATSWTEKTREMEKAYSEFRQYMVEMIRERRNEDKSDERHDLFTNLLAANDEEFDETSKLTEDELLGNIFIILLAGHDTAAHSLCFTFALLALYPEEQEILFNHIKSVIPDGRVPDYEEMMLFTQSWAVLYEGLRLFPTSPNIPKISTEDTTLVTTNQRGERRAVPVPKDTYLIISVAALHYNPKYWEDPYAFKPSRFLKDDWNRDAFIPWSAGAHSCLGRKFAETESVAILTMMILNYKISIKDEPQFAGETLEQTRDRITRNVRGLTQTPLRTPLVFTRRC